MAIKKNTVICLAVIFIIMGASTAVGIASGNREESYPLSEKIEENGIPNETSMVCSAPMNISSEVVTEETEKNQSIPLSFWEAEDILPMSCATSKGLPAVRIIPLGVVSEFENGSLYITSAVINYEFEFFTLVYKIHYNSYRYFDWDKTSCTAGDGALLKNSDFSFNTIRSLDGTSFCANQKEGRMDFKFTSNPDFSRVKLVYTLDGLTPVTVDIPLE